MSINGQDPRSNVYLLDGTLQNDFTNGPAGSAAGTALGMETIREFRVEANAYSAEFGRNSGGQINVAHQVGHQRRCAAALYEFHRNDALDARNYFDVADKPDFTRNQFGGSRRRPAPAAIALFFFVGYEALRERLGKTISTVVPDDNARLRHPARPAPVGDRSPASRPYLDEYPAPTGRRSAAASRSTRSGSTRRLDQHFVQGRVDYNLGAAHQLFARYTFDDAEQRLPTDYPQFPRAFVSRTSSSPASTGSVFSARTLQHGALRLQPHAHRPERRGEHVAAAAAVRAGPRLDRRHRHRRHAAVRAAELGEPAAGRRTSSASRTTSCTRAGGT